MKGEVWVVEWRSVWKCREGGGKHSKPAPIFKGLGAGYSRREERGRGGVGDTKAIGRERGIKKRETVWDCLFS